MLAFAADLALGDVIGRVVFNGIENVSAGSDTVAIGLDILPDVRDAFLARSKKSWQAISPFGEPAIAREYLRVLHDAATTGALPRRGSFLPYLLFALDAARIRAADGDATADMRSALLAIGIYCGIDKLEVLAGKVVPDDFAGQPAYCGGTTLGGRGDLRQHFIVSAVLRVAADAGAAFAVGEFKELLDANRGGSSFSFDDVAADLAGIRFAATLFADGAASTLPRYVLDRMARESDVIPDITDLPSGLSEAEFKHRFGAVDSPAYRSMLAAIEKRIDGLRFH